MDFSFLKKLAQKAPQLADEGMEVGDDLLRMMGPEARQMNQEFAEQAAQKARREAAEAAFTDPVENLPYKGLSGKSAQESAETLKNAPPRELLVDELGIDEGVSPADLNRMSQIGDANEAFLQYGPPGSSKLPAIPPGKPGMPQVLPAEPQLPAVIPPRSLAVNQGIDEAIETTSRVIPPANRQGLSPLQKILLGGAGAGGVGMGIASMMDGGEDPAQRAIVAAVQNPEQQVKAPAGQPVQQEARPQVIPARSTAQKPAGAVQASAPEIKTPEQVEKQDTLEPEGFTENTVEQLKDAQRKAADARMVAEFGRAGELIGSGISGAKPVAQEIFKEQIKGADKIVEDFEARGEKEKADPKSAISSQFREFVKRFGVNVPASMSAEAAAKIMPYAYQKFAAKEAQTARAFEAQENRKLREAIARESSAARAAASQEKSDELLSKQRTDKAVQLASKIQNDYFKEYNKVSDASRIIEENLKSPSPQGDIATVYSFVKILDPGSVVREGEIQFSQAARGIPEAVKGSINKYLKGQILTESERKNIAGLARSAGTRAKKVWETSAAPFIKQAKALGIEEEAYNPLFGEQQASMEAPAPEGAKPASVSTGSAPKAVKTVVRKGYNSKTNQTQFVYSDGSKEIVEGKK